MGFLAKICGYTVALSLVALLATLIGCPHPTVRLVVFIMYAVTIVLSFAVLITLSIKENRNGR